jgi:hypothetical protein
VKRVFTIKISVIIFPLEEIFTVRWKEMTEGKTALIEKYRKSGFTVLVFCREEGLNVHNSRS